MARRLHLHSGRPSPLLLLLLLIAGASAAAGAAGNAAFIAGRRGPSPSTFGAARGARRRASTTVVAAAQQEQQQTAFGPASSRRVHLGSLLSVVTGAAVLGAGPGASRAAGVDEYEVTFEGGQGLGLAIEDFGKGGKYRTYVSRVIKGSQAERSGIRIPALVVAVNGRNVEGLPKKFVVQLLKEAQQQGGPIVVTFRDPAKCVMRVCVCMPCVGCVGWLDLRDGIMTSTGFHAHAMRRFMELLNEKGEGSPGVNEELRTQLAPETKTREAQTLTVKKTYVPEICRTGAKYGGELWGLG